MIDREVSKAKSLDRSRKVSRCYQANRYSKEFGSMNQAIYRVVSSRNLEISIEEPISRCRASIETSIKVFVESPEEENLRRRNDIR